MKLFHSPNACSQASYIAINELGLACDIVKTDFADKAELLKHNIQGKVPTLVLDNGQVLTEGAVILQYLADQKPEANLMPKVGSWERYKALEALNFVATELHKPIGGLFAKTAPEGYLATQKTNAEAKLAQLNTFLGANQFMACNQYTVADIYCFTIVSWTKWVGIDMSKYPNVLGYCERISSRPAVAKTLQADSAK